MSYPKYLLKVHISTSFQLKIVDDSIIFKQTVEAMLKSIYMLSGVNQGLSSVK